MPRILLCFALSDARFSADLVHEFSMHHDVTATVDEVDPALILVETSSAPSAMWDVRATVGMFDEGAIEIDQEVGGA